MNKKRNWIVRMECVVIKDVYADNCTEEEARANPFEHSVKEEEVDQRDWEFKSIEPNE